MKLSERSIKRVAEIITGDKGRSPYRSGPNLVSFFNDFGCDHTYGQGFPSRWMFAEERIREFNGTATLKKIILSALDPRDFMGITVIDKQTQQSKPAELAGCSLNSLCFRWSRCRWTLSDDLDDSLAILAAVVVDSFGKVGHKAACRHGNRAFRIELVPGTHPPSP